MRRATIARGVRGVRGRVHGQGGRGHGQGGVHCATTERGVHCARLAERQSLLGLEDQVAAEAPVLKGAVGSGPRFVGGQMLADMMTAPLVAASRWIDQVPSMSHCTSLDLLEWELFLGLYNHSYLVLLCSVDSLQGLIDCS